MRKEALFLGDIADACRRIIERTAEVGRQDFFANDLLFDAVIRRLEIIGEAVKQLPSEIRDQRPEIEWQLIGRFRDKLIHFYFGLDEDIIWDVVRERVPELLGAVEAILNEEI